MLVRSTFVVLCLTIVNLKHILADEPKNEPEAVQKDVETKPSGVDYTKFILKVKSNDTVHTGTLISSTVVISMPGLSEQDTDVCFLGEQEKCHKPKKLTESYGELTFIKLPEAVDEPALFIGNTSRAACQEVGTDLKPNDVEVGEYFVECPNKECGYLQALVCDAKLAGVVARMEKYDKNMFVPIDYIRKAANKTLK
ncbi:hypothetical protein QE152_g1003 [Popillia japonica]|uniref:Uncharacterized protein n=1 Tax=Popillia japonica TaxID=7064 RepID=A0AAW1N4J4_POPJA